jgi:uncharacterized protein (DUF1800 family)
MSARPLLAALAGLALAPPAARPLDLDGDDLPDVWQQRFAGEALDPTLDDDADGHSNAEEAAAGTDPFNPAHRFALAHARLDMGAVTLRWFGEAGKDYQVQSSTNLVGWTDHLSALPGLGDWLEVALPAADPGAPRYHRVQVRDRDSDGDGVDDWSESQAGLDPHAAQSSPGVDDAAALAARLAADSVLRLEVVQGDAYERGADGLPSPARLRLVRSGGLRALTVNLGRTGTPVPGEDFRNDLPASIHLAFGADLADLVITPIADNYLEVPEWLTLSLQPGAEFTLDDTASSQSARLVDEEKGSELLFYAPLGAAPGVPTTASGYATLFLSGDRGSARLAVSFSNLVAPQISAHVHHHPTGNIVESLPLGQIANHAWTLPAGGAGGLPDAQAILDAIIGHELYVNVHSTVWPAGEIEGDFHRADGSIDFTPPAAIAPPPAYSGVELDRDVARLLAQASFGQTDALFTTVKLRGLEGWIADQMDPTLTPQTRILPFALAADNWLVAQNAALPTPNANYQPFFQSLVHGIWNTLVHGPDQLRQRVAFALSQVFVVSIQNATVRNRHYGAADYWDTLAAQAFGNFRDLLEAVTLHPIMANYLSMIQNEKYNPATGVSPDENYAREIMQLFTIGLVELHPDGSLRLEAGSGLPIPTYDNTDITELARVFTGWSYSKAQAGGASPPGVWNNQGAITENNNFSFRGGPPYGQAAYYHPLKMFADRHDTGAKILVGGVLIPANQSGEKDLDDALDALFHHPNTPPFVCRRLIQRLTLGNPSRGYVHRVATVFQDNGSGVRGDLGAVVRAILLDPEARTQSLAGQAGYGKLREPLMVLTHVLRALGGASQIGFDVLAPHGYTSPFPASARMLRLTSGANALGQTPLNAPSVFNWWKPDYRPPGILAAAGVTAPEFEIVTETQVFNLANLINNLFWNVNGGNSLGGMAGDVPPGYTAAQARILLSLTPAQTALATGGVPGLIDYLDLLLTHRSLTAETRAILEPALGAVTTLTGSTVEAERVKNALYLLLTSSDYLIQR